MIKFPINFEVQSSASSGIQTTWSSTTDSLEPIPCAIPPEFTGPGGGYSPEDFFALSVLTCMIATFKVYAERSQVEYTEIKGKANLTIDKHPSENTLSLTHIEITLDVTGAKDMEKSKKVLDQSIKDCAVSNSIKSGKTFHLNVS